MKNEMTSYTIKSVSVYVIMTDGHPRLAFRTREKAQEYLTKCGEVLSNNLMIGTTIQQVYLETVQIPIKVPA